MAVSKSANPATLVAVPNAVENSRPLIQSGEREKKNESYRTLASGKAGGGRGADRGRCG
jgi:hypothetical protein